MLLYSLIIFLFYNSVNLRRDRTILFSRISLIILLYSIVIGNNNLDIIFLEKGIGLFGGLFHLTPTTYIFHLFIFLICMLIIGLTSFYPRKIWLLKQSGGLNLFFSKFVYKYKTVILNKMGEQFRIMEYSLILLFIIAGALLLISTSDLVSIFLAIELQSYGLYLISTIYRNSELSTAGGLTYFLLGGLSSCFILLATSLLYANSGTTNLDNLYIITTISETINNPEINYNIIYWYKSHYINLSLLLMAIGFLFKVSAAPFHFWSPDVYDAIPTIVTTFVAIVAKISIFVFLLELVHYTSKSLYTFNWTTGLLISSLLSLIIGTVLGLTQFRIKRLYAYSTISHVGFILLALTIQSVESVQAFIFYLIQYSITNLNAFILLIAIGYSFYNYINNDREYSKLHDKNNSPIQLISQLKGYFYINPMLSISLAITLFSFIGVPPMIGFFAKQLVLTSALDNGYVFMSFVAILTSVISAVYYLVVIKQMFFDKTDNNINTALTQSSFSGTLYNNSVPIKINFNHKNIVLSSYYCITISILTLIMLSFMFINKFWINLTNILALTIFYN